MITATNILYLPVVILEIETQTNADWLDGLEYRSDDDPTKAEPIDLTGIDFDLNLRSSPPVATVMLRASTYNGLISIYANTWQLMVPAAMMALIFPGDYVFDILGRADGYTRNLVQARVSVIQGITRTPAPGAAMVPMGSKVVAFNGRTLIAPARAPA